MESEKVKEIKESLQQEIHIVEYVDDLYANNVSLNLLKDTLTLINELESENDEQYKRIMELEQDLVHADENVFYRECNVTLRENEIKEQALKQFAERLKEQIKAKVDYYNDEVFDYGYNGIREVDIDETLKEFLK